MIKELIGLANDLDAKGFAKEADALDGIITKAAGMFGGKIKALGGQRQAGRERGNFGPMIPQESSIAKSIIMDEEKEAFKTYYSGSKDLRTLAHTLATKGINSFEKIKDAASQTEHNLGEQALNSFVNSIIKEQNPEMFSESAT